MAKWFKNIAMLACCFMAVFFVFTGCNGSGMAKFQENPAVTDDVYGNGSLAVTKGEYLYFVNGYISYSSVGDKNNGTGDSEYASLYRVKLDANGHVVENDKEYDEDGKEIFDETQGIKDVDILCKKVVGFESMGLYIFGDYIYFATPNNEKDSSLNMQTSLVDFCRTKIDRSSGIEKLYTTTADNTKVSYAMYQVDNEVVLLVKDDAKLIACKIINGKSQGYRVIENSITSVAFPKYSSSTDVVTDLDKSVYYTRAIDSSKDSEKDLTGGNVLCKLLIKDLSTEKLRADNKTTYSVLSTNGNFVAVSKTNNDLEDTLSGEVFAITNFAKESTDKQISKNAYTTILPVATDLGLQIIAYDSTNKAIYKLNGVASDAQNIYTGEATLVKVEGDYVYFIASSQLYRVNYVQGTDAESLVSGAILATAGNYFSINENYIYYLKNYTTNDTHEHEEDDVHAEYYLHMIDLNSTDEDGKVYDHFVGVLMEENYLVDPSASTTA